ncbi:carboxypeptidase-like protein [Algoriphagus antarcticus]|uniref:Carboxypeptidase-like protein n=2 Tax=Algoriphagus antarcticus TaxID=238540 RepID=A0A3E0E3Y8_9BACT|nr:carboxypeptidase-like protein [Algoriphagus antarcticus]
MKTSVIFHKQFAMILTCIALTVSFLANAQTTEKLTGTLLNASNEEPVPFANAVLYQLPDSIFIAGTNTDSDGNFHLPFSGNSPLFLKFSYMGFENVILTLEDSGELDLGKVYIRESEMVLETLVVAGEKVKGSTEGGKAVFLINKQHVAASNTGMDILNQIPGVFVDFNQSIRISGKNKIIIFVDGAERDHRYVQQLRAEQIDKIELVMNPSAMFAGEADAVIHILLAEKETGFSGMVYAELPISRNEVYSFPTASLSIYTPKLHAYTSYNGAFSFFDVTQSYERKIFGEGEILTDQQTRQRSLSHTLHQGLEYAFAPSTLLHGYLAASWFSETHNGNITLQKNEMEPWIAQRQEKDWNRSVTTALYLQHEFNKEKDKGITVDWTHSRLMGENRLTLLHEEESFVNATRPEQKVSNLKVDFRTRLTSAIRLMTGFQIQQQHFGNGHENSFDFKSSVQALYSTIRWKKNAWDMEAGLRTEQIHIQTANQDKKRNHLYVLPNVRMGYVWNERHSARFFFRSAMVYPLFHQLNDFEATLDPYTISFGNQDLQPYIYYQANLEHTWNTGNLMLMNSLFFEKRSNVINSLNSMNTSGLMEVTFDNLGDLYQIGLQSSGSLRLSKSISLNHMIRIFHSSGVGNEIENFPSRDRLAMETGFSGIMAIKKDITITLRFRYLSPVYDIQSNLFSGPLYFVAGEKKLGDQWKVGLTSALPFSRKFTYYGLDTKGDEFYQRAIGQINMSRIPLWFTVNYSFQKGKKVKKENRNVSSGLHINKRGF